MDIGTASMAVLEAWATVSQGRPAQEHRLSDLGRIERVAVDGEAGLSRRWATVLEAEHFLGAGPLGGAAAALSSGERTLRRRDRAGLLRTGLAARL